MKYTFVYHLDCVPEYDFDALEGNEYREARLLQKGFMDNVISFLSIYGRFSLELRFQNNPADLAVDAWLVISGTSDQLNTTNKDSFRKQLEGLLPEHYAYNSIQEEKVSGMLLPESMYYGFKLRRLPEVIPVGRFNLQYAGSMLLSPMTNYEQGVKESDAAKISFSVPSIPELVESSDNWYTLFRQIQLSRDPLALRIAITKEELSPMEKRLATHYYRELLDHPLQTAIRTEYERAQLAGTGKYLENNWLFGANIQVGSMDRFTGQCIAASLANLICGAGRMFVEEVATPDNITAPIWKNWLYTELEYDLPAALPFRIRTKPEEDFFRRGISLFSRSEIGNIFKIPVADHRGLPGLFSKRVNPFYAPQLSKKMDKTIKLGRLIKNRAFVSAADALLSEENHPSEEYHINLADMAKHVFLCGVPGSGKTFCTKSIIGGLLLKDVPFLLIEPCKSEYYDELKELSSASGKSIRLFQFSSPYLKDGAIDRSFLRFNPLIPRKGSTIAEHISSLKSALMAAMPMQGVMPGIFSDFLNEFYLTFTGQDEKLFFDRDFVSAGLQPAEYCLSVSSFSDFSMKYFADRTRFNNAKGQLEIISILMKRITKFTTGILGQIFKPEYCGADTELMEENIDYLLNESCVLDLEALGDDEDKALIMAFVLTFLNQDRMKRKSHDDTNQLHVALVEEAHRLFQSGTPGGNLEQGETMGAAAKTGSLFNNLLAESRAKAQSIVIIEQSPTKMPADVIKNTTLKIQLRLNYQEDREYIGKAMSMNKEQIEFSSLLRPGEAVVFDDTLDKPILIKIEK